MRIFIKHLIHFIEHQTYSKIIELLTLHFYSKYTLARKIVDQSIKHADPTLLFGFTCRYDVRSLVISIILSCA